MSLPTSYDTTFFRSKLHRGRHIESIHTNCLLRGVQTEAPFNARVLEIGCATGHAIIPMATEYPQAQFVGVDPSNAQIQEGASCSSKLGLSNIDFRCGTVSDVIGKTEKFDYILCHGVISWVSNEDRAKILNTIQQSLSSNGVSLISYNVAPGSTLRQSLWKSLKEITHSASSLSEARSLLKDYIAIIEFDYERPYQILLYQEIERILSESDSYLVHEVFASQNYAFSYREFSNMVSEYGLTQIGDVRPHRNGMNRLNSSHVPDDAYQAFSRLQKNLLSTDLLLDGTTGLPFRESIVISSNRIADEIIDFDKYYTLSYSIASCQILENQEDDSISVRAASGRIEKIAHQLLKDIFNLLASFRPNFVPFSIIQKQFSLEDPLLIARALSECINREVVLVSNYPPVVATSVFAHPNTTEYLRLLSSQQQDCNFTNLLYETVEVDPLAAKFLQHLNGQTDKDAIQNLVKIWLNSGQGSIRADGVVVEDLNEIEQNLPTLVESTLQTLRKGGLLLP